MDKKFNFEDNLKYINENKTTSKNEFKKQGDVLDEELYNNSFKSIEKDLNLLYEKVRILQDCILYSNMQLKNEISNTVEECRSTIKAIEDGRDSIKDSAFVLYPVEFFISNTENYTDRDSKQIRSASIIQEKICTSSNISNLFTPTKSTVDLKYRNNILENNIETMIKEKSYRSLYMFNSIANNKIAEKITLRFDSPVTMNFFNCNLVNCKIEKMEFKLADDSVEEIKVDNLGKIKERTIKEMYIEIKAINYISSQKNYLDLKGEFWDKIDELNIDQNLYFGKDKFYYYLFGIDKIQIGYASSFNESCFISPEIFIGDVKDDAYIEIDEVSSVEGGSVEYSIIDGTNTIDIVPEDTALIEDEKIFYKTGLRFPYDAEKEIVIKINGNRVTMPLFEAINMSTEDIITASYFPIKKKIKVLNDKIKVRAIIREYDKANNTFIKSIKVKKYGGGLIWKDMI